MIGFLNGLLQYSPDCALVTPPALGAAVAPSSHLSALALALEGAAGGASADTVPQRGSRRKRAKQRQHERRKLPGTAGTDDRRGAAAETPATFVRHVDVDY